MRLTAKPLCGTPPNTFLAVSEHTRKHMKLNFTKTWGQYAISVTAEVSEEQLAALATEGALHLFERGPSGVVEQKVCAPELGWTKNEKGSGFKRPKEFERRNYEFTPERAEKFKAVFNSTPGKIEEDNEITYTVNSIVQHDGGQASEMVRATTLVDSFLGNPVLEAPYRMILEEGSATPFTREELIAAAHAKKLGIQPAKSGK